MNVQPALNVRQILHAFRGGSSWPVLVDADGHRCVMKWRGSAEGPGANAADLIALRLAHAVGVPVPTPRILHLTEAVIDPKHDPELNDLVRRSVGTNLGIDEVTDFRPYEPGHRADVPEALRVAVYALDLLLLNMDRIESNPNMVMTPDGLLCWDYAAAMELRMLLTGRQIDETRFYSLLRQHPFFVETLPKLDLSHTIDEATIAGIIGGVPEDWLPASINRSSIHDRLVGLFDDAQATIRRRHGAIALITVESQEARSARTSANRRAFEEAVQRMSKKPGSFGSS